MNILLLEGQPGNMWMTIAIYGGIAVAFWFFLLRPQKKKQRAEEELRNAVEVGDVVIMTSGITGKVIAIKDDEVTIENGLSRTQLTFVKGAITRVTTKANGESTGPSVDDRKADLQKKLDEKNAAKKAEREAAKNAKDDKLDLL